MPPQRSLQLVLALVLVMGLAAITHRDASAAARPLNSAHGQVAVAPAGPLRAATSLKREVFGFGLASSLSDPTVGYPSWNFSLLTTVAFFGLHVNSAGAIVADSGWNTWNSAALTGLLGTAHASGTRVVVTVVLQDFSPGTPAMCAGLMNRATTVAQTVAQVAAKGVDGINVDYEGLNGTCGNGQSARGMMTDFVRQLRAALSPGSYLSVDTYAGAAADSLGFFDVPGLGAYVDSFFVMAYDLEYSNYQRPPVSCSSFCLGPTAPLNGYFYNDTATTSQYVAAVPASKVILGVPYYGRKSCVGGAVPNAFAIGSVTADSYLDASTESSAPSVSGFATHRDANDPAGGERWDTWFNSSLGCTRELYWDDATSLGAKYDLVNANNLRGVGIWTLNYGGGAPELWSALSAHFAGCSGLSVSSNPAASARVGTAVTLTAKAASCPNPNPLYQFWILAPGSGAYRLAQAYSSNPTLGWNTSGAVLGTYSVSVWVRDSASAGTSGNALGRWDAYASTLYTLTSSACSSVTASSAPASPAAIGSAVTITAAASGCANPLYQFWSLVPGATAYKVVQAYSPSPTLQWNTTGAPGGDYAISIWVRDANSAGDSSNSFGRWDAYTAVPYTIVAPCSAVAVSWSPAASATIGARAAVTAQAAGCPHPLYQFWIQVPGASTFRLAQAYSSNPTLQWNTAGAPAGTYTISVWVRDSNSTGATGNALGRWDAFTTSQYALVAPCAAVSVTSSPRSQASRGTTVTFTAQASGCSNPTYQFWILVPGATSYRLAQSYSANPTLQWNSAGAPAGGYVVSVWVRDANSTGTAGNAFGQWDAYVSTQYTLN